MLENLPYNFEEFNQVSFEKWVEKIKTDLRGKSIDSLNWEFDSGKNISPFAHRDNAQSDILLNNEDIIFKDNECLFLSECTVEKTAINQATNNGVDGLIFKWNGSVESNFASKKYFPSISQCSWKVDQMTNHALSSLLDLRNKNRLLKGYIFQDEIPSLQELELRVDAYNNFISSSGGELQLRMVMLGNGFDGWHGPIRELAIICSQLVYFIECLSNAPEEIAKNTFINLNIRNTFYLETARIRALKFLSSVILSEYGVDVNKVQIPIHVNTVPKVGMEVISNTSQIMSAFLGGCDTISTMNLNSDVETFRIHSNIIKILKEESFIDKTSSPIRGSYFMNDLLTKIIECSWSEFVEIENNGGYKSLIKG